VICGGGEEKEKGRHEKKERRGKRGKKERVDLRSFSCRPKKEENPKKKKRGEKRPPLRCKLKYQGKKEKEAPAPSFLDF